MRPVTAKPTIETYEQAQYMVPFNEPLTNILPNIRHFLRPKQVDESKIILSNYNATAEKSRIEMRNSNQAINHNCTRSRTH